MRATITATLLTAAALLGLGTALPDTVLLTPRTETLLRSHKGTAEVRLPKHDNRRRLERKYSVAPGRLNLPRRLEVNKKERRVRLLNAFGDTLMTFPVCASAIRGQKYQADDMRTPEGTFSIYGIYNSTRWEYKNTGQRAYGPWFIHINTYPFYGIGIHGTNAPYSVPGRSSHGCMRMHNDEVTALKAMIPKDATVSILPDYDEVAKPLVRRKTPPEWDEHPEWEAWEMARRAREAARADSIAAATAAADSATSVLPGVMQLPEP